ncbi:MAG: aminopeptidase P family protein [Neisseriaceae bacterium]
MDIAKRLQIFRKHMDKFGLDFYLVPSIDAHNSEYVPECWKRRGWISGFDGSAGEVLITKEHAYLWTDGRYFLKAEQQLNFDYYTLMKQSGFVSEIEQWLIDNAIGKKVGVDPQLVGIERAEKLKESIHSVGGELVFLEDNLVDLSRVELGEKLNLPNSQAFYLEANYTGVTLAEKLAWIYDELDKLQVDYIVLNVLDEIAWLFNIRGSDIDYNPLAISYAIIGKNKTVLFIDSNKVDLHLSTLLSKSGVILLQYSEFGDYLSKLNGTVMLDCKTANYWMLDIVSKVAKINLDRSPIVLAKAIKNNVEIDGARKVHYYDAKAIIEFLSWLEQSWQNGVDEIAAADKLSEFRRRQPTSRGDSFATISGFAGNGSIIHYQASHETNKVIDDSSLYLIDSGGQYLNGTTDITRTIHLGIPTATQKRHYTLVLKGHLALGNAVFPHGTNGEHLDALARLSLWKYFLNYRHGTGHGVGSFLCVHEGPQRISPGLSGVALLPGMILSNEPGFYLDNEYGIRIENLCLIKEIEDSRNSDYGLFYALETLTMVPYCKKLIDVNLLSKEEQGQILAYYEEIRKKVYPELSLNAQKWLENELNLF